MCLNETTYGPDGPPPLASLLALWGLEGFKRLPWLPEIFELRVMSYADGSA